MYNLEKHIIREIVRSGEKDIIVNINNEIETNKISFELVGMNINDTIEYFNHPVVFNKILTYLMENDLFRGFNVVNY